MAGLFRPDPQPQPRTPEAVWGSGGLVQRIELSMMALLRTQFSLYM